MIRCSLGDTGIAAPLSECTSVVLTDHGLAASHAAGKACPQSHSQEATGCKAVSTPAA